MIFNIGQTIFVARSEPAEKWITCPHCFGKKFLTVILGDDSRVQIDCAGCSLGYESPSGFVRSSDFCAGVEQHTITGMDIKTNSNGEIEVMYWSGCYGYEGNNSFATEAEAMARAELLLAERNKEEANRLANLKTRDDRTWAWNVTYHRDCLKKAKRDVEYHTAKLEVCKSKAKTT